MLTPARIKASEHYPLLKSAVEIRHAKKYALMYGLLTLFCAFLVWTPVSLKEDPGAYSFLVALVVLGISPFWLFYLARIALIYQGIDGFRFYEVLLDRPKGGMLRNSICFALQLPESNGTLIPAETNAIFSSRSDMELSLESYVNQKVLVAYHPKTERVVVIRKLEK